MSSAKVALLFCSAGVLGCEEASPRIADPLYFRFSDSAVSDIRELDSSELSRVARWDVEPDPSLRMGSIDGIDAIGALSHTLRLPDGRFMGADSKRDELLVFDTGGHFQEAWGRSGPGPGEFQWPGWLGYCSGHVYALDQIMNVVHLFDLEGAYTRSFRPLISSPVGGPYPALTMACNLEGQLGGISAWGGGSGGQRPVRGGPYRLFETVALGDADKGLASVARIAGEDRYRFPDGGSGPWWPVEELGRRPSLALSDRYAFVATGDAFEIAVYDFDGTMRRLIRVGYEDRSPLTPPEIARMREELIASREGQSARASLRRTLEDWVWPAYRPAIAALLVDSDGCLWVRHGPRDFPGQQWSVLTPTGEPRAFVELPAGFELMQVEQATLIGREEGVRGEDYIVTYGYQRDDSRCN